MQARKIEKVSGPLDCVLQAAPSKSVTHRALVVAALADGESAIVGPLDADDTRHTLNGLSALGVNVRAGADRWIVAGCGGAVPGGATIHAGDSGTSLRLLTALAALGLEGSSLDGSPRLRQRPMGELVDALTALGADVRPGSSPGGLPLRVERSGMHGGRVRVPGHRSSQFSSALLLIAARLEGTTDVQIEPPAVSLPYVELTARVLEEFGVKVERPDVTHFRVRGGPFDGREYRVEGDHSSASYFLVAAALLGGRVRVNGLSYRSSQPDARLGRILEALGCRVEATDNWIEVEGSGGYPAFDLDLSDAPDLVPTLAVLALFADGPSTLRGIAHLRLKESDRIAALAENIRALGREATVLDDGLRIGGREEPLRPTTIRTRADHRIAMAFAVAGLKQDGIVVDDPACVSKSQPLFWQQLEELAG